MGGLAQHTAFHRTAFHNGDLRINTSHPVGHVSHHAEIMGVSRTLIFDARAWIAL